MPSADGGNLRRKGAQICGRAIKAAGFCCVIAVAIIACKPAVQAGTTPGEDTSVLKIIGDAVIGSKLSVDITPMGDEAEIRGIGISFQWQRLDAGTAVDIAGATEQDYVAQEEDEGLTLKALVSLVGLEIPFETNEVGPVIWPPIEGTVTLNEIPLVPGVVLTATAKVTSPGTIYYEWLSGNETLNNTAATYTIQESDVDNFITVRVGTTKSSGALTAQTSSAVQSYNTVGNVSITGTPLNPGTSLGATISFDASEVASRKWLRDGTTQVGTGEKYTIAEADVGHTIKLVVERVGYAGLDISAVTSTITWPAWTGTIKWADANPASPIAGVPFKLEVTAGNGAGTRTISWKLVGASETDVTAANLAGDKLSYTPALAEKGKKLKVTVSYSKNEAPKTLTSTQSVIPLTIKYNANGGTGTMMTDSEFAFGDASAKLKKNTFTKGTENFAGWATTNTGAKVYDDEAKVSEVTSYGTGTITLYAVWVNVGISLSADREYVQKEEISTDNGYLGIYVFGLPDNPETPYRVTWTSSNSNITTKDSSIGLSRRESGWWEGYTWLSGNTNNTGETTITAAILGVSGNHKIKVITEKERLDALPYKVGDTGPGGGKVFYVSAIPKKLSSGFAKRAGTYHYMEAAPADIGKKQWSTNGRWLYVCQTIPCPHIPKYRHSNLWYGYDSSSWIEARAQDGDKNNNNIAALAALSYRGGEKDDWFLPNYSEFQMMVKNKAAAGITLSEEKYWTSNQNEVVQMEDGIITRTYADSVTGKGNYESWKSGEALNVRPIRYF